MTEGNGFIFKTSGNATYEITFEWGSKKTFADKTSWSDPKRRKIKLRFINGNTVNACTVGDNNVENANTKVSQKIDYSDYCHVYFKDNFLYVNGKNVCSDSVGETQKENAYVSIKTWANVSMIDFKEYGGDPAVKTGYTVEELAERTDPKVKNFLNGKVADVIVDGPFKQELRDVTLKMRGSSNQCIITLPVDFTEKI